MVTYIALNLSAGVFEKVHILNIFLFKKNVTISF